MFMIKTVTSECNASDDCSGQNNPSVYTLKVWGLDSIEKKKRIFPKPNFFPVNIYNM